MPQNIFVGQQARAVAAFVSRFAGREAPPEPDVVPCVAQPIGTLPPLPTGTSLAASGVNPAAGNSALTTTTPAVKSAKAKKAAGTYAAAHRKHKKSNK